MVQPASDQRHTREGKKFGDYHMLWGKRHKELNICGDEWWQSQSLEEENLGQFNWKKKYKNPQVPRWGEKEETKRGLHLLGGCHPTLESFFTLLSLPIASTWEG